MKRKINLKKVIIVLIIILLLIVMVTSTLIKKLTKNEENNDKVDTRTEQQKEDDKINKLKNSTESERIKTYLGTYFKYIEKGKLSDAYELLYPEFKNNYFKTLEDFEKYINNKNYPELMAIDYKTISTQGKYYLVTVDITDMINPNNEKIYSEDLTILENDYNVFYISFKI